MVNFNFTNAQSVFRKLYELARDHGQKDSNWSALEATCMLNNLLALDNSTERATALQVYLVNSTSKQASLDYDYRNYTEEGDIWPESLQYAGGVGSIAVALLGGMGYTVAASTGRPAEADYLKGLGASRILDRAELSSPGKPLQTERWAGVVYTVGSHTLANACAQARWYGAVAACGLAQGGDFPATVMPFILRGVTLYGINSIQNPKAERREAWALIARHVDAGKLEAMTGEIGLSEVIAFCPSVLEGKVRGRTVVDVNR